MSATLQSRRKLDGDKHRGLEQHDMHGKLPHFQCLKLVMSAGRGRQRMEEGNRSQGLREKKLIMPFPNFIIIRAYIY